MNRRRLYFILLPLVALALIGAASSGIFKYIINNPQNNQVLTYIAADSAWENRTGGGGGGASWGSIAGTVTDQTDVSPSLIPTAVKTTNYTAVGGDLVPVDTTSGNITVTLPTAPASGTRIAVKQVVRGGTNVVTIAAGGADVFNRAGGSVTATVTLLNQADSLQYNSGIWYVLSDDLTLSQLDSRYALSSIVVNGHALTGNVTVTAGDVSLGNVLNPSLQTFSDANVSITSGKTTVIQTGTLSASRTVTLPAASAYLNGTGLYIVDASGTATATNSLVITRAGSDTINGATTLTLVTGHAAPLLVSDGTSKWTVDIRGTTRGGTGTATAPTTGQVMVGQSDGTYLPKTLGLDATINAAGNVTFSTVNSNVGAFTNANITVNAKGLVTAAANGSGGSAAGYQTSSYQVGFPLTSSYTTTITLPINGGAIEVPIYIAGNQKIIGISYGNRDSSGAHTLEWRIYTDPGSNPANEVAGANGTYTFTPGAASIVASTASSPVTVNSPGIYWVVLRNTSASVAAAIGSAAGGSFTPNIEATQTLGSSLGSTLDLATGWSKSTSMIAIRIDGAIQGSASAF